MAELTVAINKHWRAVYFPENGVEGAEQEKKVLEAKEKIIEEIADVEIMLDQIKLFLDDYTGIADKKLQKLQRQLKRIEKESTC